MTYRYVAKSFSGRVITGTIEANDITTVRENLNKLGFIPIQIKEVPARKESKFSFTSRVKDVELINLTRQFATLHRAGLPMLTIIRTLAEQATNRYLKSVLESIAKDINEGVSLSDAMAKHPQVFSNYYVSCIKAGEKGGVLDQVFEQLLVLLDRQRQTRSEIKAATRYPMMVIFGIIIAFVVLVGFVLPRFTQMFTALGVELPLPARILVGINYVFQHYWFMILGTIAGLALIWWLWINSPPGRMWWDRIKLRLPLVGRIIYYDLMTRFSRMFATLDASGLPILETLNTVATTANNKHFEQHIKSIRKSVYDGTPLAEAMRGSRLFPPLVIEMIHAGEESGSLDDMLNKVGDHYERELTYSLKGLTGIIEPILTVILGGVIVFFFLAVFLPYLNLLQGISAGAY